MLRTILFFHFFFYSTLSFAQELRDVRPPVLLPSNLRTLIIILIALFLLGAAGVAFYFYRKKLVQQMHHKSPDSALVQSAWAIAFERLNALEQRNLIVEGKLEQFYTELSDIVRHYIENRFSLRAPEMTTEEFLVSLKESNALTDQQKNTLKEFLISSDMVKFAKFAPTDEQAHSGYSLAEQFVQETIPQVLEEGARQ